MARPPSVTLPRYKLSDARTAARQIERIRRAGKDPDLAFFPASVDDDDDVDDVISYVERHRNIRSDVAAAELPHRAKLIAHQYQRSQERHDRRILAILETGRNTDTPATSYGRWLGLPTRGAVYLRRRRLIAKLRNHGEMPRTAAESAEQNRTQTWLTANAAELRHVAEALADYEPQIVALAAPEHRDALTDAIDAAGQAISSRPGRTLAGAISFALFHIDEGLESSAQDTVIKDALRRGRRLRAEFNALRDNTP